MCPLVLIVSFQDTLSPASPPLLQGATRWWCSLFFIFWGARQMMIPNAA